MSPTSADKKDSVSSDDDGVFLCGVVEGFYGRPWTTEQRKDLFTKMQVRLLCPYIHTYAYEDCIYLVLLKQSQNTVRKRGDQVV